jgi:hypothetical protein
MDLRLWQSFLYRRDVQKLSKPVRMTLVELAACVAQGEVLPDGYMSSGIPAWLNQPLETTLEEIDVLVEAGFLIPDEATGGWHFDGWLDDLTVPRPGNPLYEKPAWGQRSIAKAEESRRLAKERQAKYRALLKEGKVPEGVDPDTGEIIQDPNPPF